MVPNRVVVWPDANPNAEDKFGVTIHLDPSKSLVYADKSKASSG